MKKILIIPNERKLRNGKKNPKDYPYWDELKEKLTKKYEVNIIKDILPFKEWEKIIHTYDKIITIDSFFQHFCWYHNKKCIVIFGKSDPIIFGHVENTNILKSRANLRQNQFDIWESEEYDPNVFNTPDEIIKEAEL